MWMTILVLQAVPYAAALVCAGLSALPEFRPRTRSRKAIQPLPALQPPAGDRHLRPPVPSDDRDCTSRMSAGESGA